MKRLIQRYGLLVCSLGLLFASGIAAGYRWGTLSREKDGVQAAPAAAAETTPEQWSENAAAALKRDLGLDEAQTEKIRGALAGPALEIFEDKHQANLKIDLRLLDVHGKLQNDAILNEKQKARLKLRREQLLKLIHEKFRDFLEEHPEPALSEL